jgi:hypothetical protein
MRNNYNIFNEFVLRSPIFSFSFYQELTSQNKVDNEKFKSLFKDPIIQEAIFLASPHLFSELEKWVDNKLMDVDKEEKLLDSFFKYLSRMSSRCTPFGIFAGCSVGQFSDSTDIVMCQPSENRRHTRLDMNYLVSLSQDFVKIKFIKDQLVFYPNSSIYKIGNQFRYIEYYYKNTKRHHQIVSIEATDYLTHVIENSIKGITINELADLLKDDEITLEEAKSFVEELIEGQLLVSELEPSVSGDEFLFKIIKTLSKIKGAETIINILNNVNVLLNKIDKKVGNSITLYNDIIDELKKIESTFDIKYLFQADLVVSTKSSTLDYLVKKNIIKGVTFLNKIKTPYKESYLDSFKDEFYKRYESKTVSLSHALDVEIGVGYMKQQMSYDYSPLVHDLILSSKNDLSRTEIIVSKTETILQKKILNAIKSDQFSFSLEDGDFVGFSENWKDLPSTFCAMIEIVENDEEKKIFINNLGGVSAGNILGRFCHSDEKIHTLVKKIVSIEECLNQDKILAEIVHLPEARTGNVLMRPTLRKFEIPYLAKSELESKSQLLIEDLTISIKSINEPILLKSIKYNKEVIPHLTNAHNYGYNSLPIYNFLASLQAQNKRKSLNIEVNDKVIKYDFIPRIEYGNIILFKATWYIKNEEIEELVKAIPDDLIFTELLTDFVIKRKLPKYVLLEEGDNELLINFHNHTSVKMLLRHIKNKFQFKLVEFLHSKNYLIKNEHQTECFTNQFIISFHKNDFKNKNGAE